jgi:hypothetical protein
LYCPFCILPAELKKRASENDWPEAVISGVAKLPVLVYPSGVVTLKIPTPPTGIVEVSVKTSVGTPVRSNLTLKDILGITGMPQN